MKNRLALSFVVLLGLTMTQAVPAWKAPSKTIDKKTLVDEEPIAKKAEITEETPGITIEGAEEPKQADRAKKSASTTFCVEIRPGPAEAPVKVCENQPPPPIPPTPVPQVPQEAHEINEQPPPPPPIFIEQSETPFFIIPPNPTELFVPQEPCAPQVPSYQSFVPYPQMLHPQPPPPQHMIIPSTVSNLYPQAPLSPPPQQHIIIPSTLSNLYPQALPSPPPQQHIIIPAPVSNPYAQSPCPPSPCALTSGSGLHPHAALSPYRSALAPMDGALSSSDGMEMRSSDNEASGMNSGATISSGMETNQDFKSDAMGTPFARTHLKKLHGPQSSSYYPSSSYNQRSPYIVRCNPQLLSLGNGGSVYTLPSGRGRSSDGAFNGIDNNGQLKIAGDGLTHMDMSQQARHHIIQPVVQPYMSGSGYPSHSVIPSVVQHTTYQSYQSQLNPYSVNHHSPLPGYSVHPQPSNIVVPSISVHAHPGVISPGTGHMHRRDQQRQQQSEQQQQQNQDKSRNREAEERDSTVQKNGSEQSGPMSPSQMLNQMRVSGGSSGYNKRPMMQSFPRVNEDRSSNDNGVNVNMNIPRGGQPFMISEQRGSMDENKLDMDADRVPMHDEMGKRDTEKREIPASEKKD